MLLSTYVYRGSRIVALAVAHGYGSEAVGVYRRMVESGSALHYLADDATGQRATEWFAARGRKGAKLVGQDHWEMLSRSAHADARHSAWMRDAEDTTAVHASRLPIDDLVCVLAAAQCADVARHVLTNARAEHRDFPSSIVLSRTL